MKQLLLLLLLFLSIILISCSHKEQPTSVIIGQLPKDQMKFQKMIISELTGKQEIDILNGESLLLKSRWNKYEKRVSLDYFESLFNQLDLNTYRHKYQMANSNFAVDLLIEPLKGTNIYTILPSTNNSKEYVVIGAHYDTDGKNFPGAIDNGSGIALVTSVLRQLREIKNRNRNLIVVYFDQEEESISAGSLAFAKFLKAHKYNIHSVHCFDLIGWDADKNKEVQLDLPKPYPEIEGIYKRHAQKLNIPIYSVENNASDYASFFKENINVIGISQAYAKGELSGKKDSPADKFHLVDFEYLASSTKLSYEVIKELIYDRGNKEE